MVKKFTPFINDYISNLISSIRKIDFKKLKKASDLILKTVAKKKNYICMWEWRFRRDLKSLYL